MPKVRVAKVSNEHLNKLVQEHRLNALCADVTDRNAAVQNGFADIYQELLDRRLTEQC